MDTLARIPTYWWSCFGCDSPPPRPKSNMIVSTSSCVFWISVVFVLIGSCQGQNGEDTVYFQPQPDGTKLNRVIVDQSSGSVFIGAVNHIFQLDSDLSVVHQAVTGPKLDNEQCITFDQQKMKCQFDGQDYIKENTDNINKVLVLDSQNDRLITCGSIFQGTCEVRLLSNITVGDEIREKNSVTDSRLFIAANSELGTTVAFIGPGPAEDVLYVGTSYTSVELHRKAVPLIASRDLASPPGGELLKVAYHNDVHGRGTYRKWSIGEPDVIDYKAGFSLNSFSYFFTIDEKRLTEDGIFPYVSRLTSICQNDQNYFSYAEFPLVCKHKDETYNLVQSATFVKAPDKMVLKNREKYPYVIIAVFSKSVELNNNKEPSKRSAVCVYDLADVRAAVKQNFESCFKGNNGCTRTINRNVTEDFCGEKTRAHDHEYVIGNIELVSSAVLTYDDTLLTAITMDTVDSFLVAHIGTGDGRLKRAYLSSTTEAEEYASLDISSGVAILPDMPFDTPTVSPHHTRHLYVMTEQKLYKVPVEQCGRQMTCAECTEPRDPYCGWCSLERTCSRADSCTNSEYDKRWLWSNGVFDACISIRELQPEKVVHDKQEMISLTVESLPPLQGENSRYMCMFGDGTNGVTAPETIGRTMGTSIECPTPEVRSVPAIPSGQDHVNVSLGIKSSETQTIFLETNFTFYDCGQHDRCSSCSSSLWGCAWCIYDNKCVSDEAQCASPGGSDPNVVRDKETEQCPRIDHNLSGNEEILIPEGVPQTITLQGANLPIPLDGSKGYECLIYTQQPPIRVQATRRDDHTVECEETEYEYNMEEKEVNIGVVWHDNFLIEDHAVTTVTLYSCREMAADCSKCISLQEKPDTSKYECRWCTDSCEYRDTCTASATFASECPKPQITKVTPLKGPIGGGTLVTIEGSNLGTKFSDVQNGVKVAGVKCKVDENKYSVSERIVCEAAPTGAVRKGNVSVTVANSGTTTGPMFSYENPILKGMTPTLGPMSGGTRVTLTGSSLDAGSTVNVTLGTSSVCVIEDISDINSTSIVCTTQKTNAKNVTGVRATFDGSVKTLSKPFSFTKDPEITEIKPLKAFLSGGRELTIKGTNLNSIQKPVMFLQKVNAENRRRRGRQTQPDPTASACVVRDRSTMICPTPRLTPTNATTTTDALSPGGDTCSPPYTLSADADPTSTYRIGFVMDGVVALRDLSTYDPDLKSDIVVLTDPVYLKFKEKQIFEGGLIELQGTNLDLACTKKEVIVKIGQELCNVSVMESERLFCEPPDEQPAGVEEGALPVVTVTVGNVCQTLGEVEYTERVTIRDGSNDDVWKIALGAVGGFLCMVIFVILVVYKRQNRAAEQQYKAMQLQLDTLESNVRNECKQAFAELQTEVSDFTSDINVIGIPFWDYKTYTFKVLFPSLNDHSVLHTQVTYHTNQFGSLQYNSASKHGYDQGLHQFNQLLNSKQFILIFIRTLEQQKNFSIRDKAQVASLLMIVLQDKMDYATDILKALLNELIDRSVEKKHPKLMLRRTESVVEKMLTNWLSICMYSYLKKHAGKSLFMLHKAIKHQTEKGVIDAITSEARYSLSEDRLLREKMDPKTLTVYLVTDENREPITCKMLDLDTITQAKEKALDAIYMNTPITRRPNVHDVDLEWRSGRSGHLPLQDEDVTTEVIAGWKKVNTLLHYHVPDGATMALVPKRNKTDGVRNVNGMIELTSSLSATTPIMTMEEGTKVWHLVKHDDGIYSSRTQKVISEIFLTRLLATKGTLQQYIDDLFMTILRVDSAVPPAIKYLFDFLDQAARRHTILDPDVVHTWKSNSLPLRFWVNIIKNPEFVFDINKSPIVDSCLSVVAQTFMDSCSTSEHRLGKDSPSNKLLFAKDIPRYRNWVAKFYRGIQEMPAVTEQSMQQSMMELSMSHIADFNVTAALKDLYKYAQQYSFEFLENLDDDPSAKKLHLANKFEQVAAIIDGAPMY